MPPAAARSTGLREKKKSELRQRLSDTATAMFLERGFRQVSVREVAAACGVSEKTVYNHFPSKESLVFDRGEVISEALARPVRGAEAVLDAVLETVVADLDRLDRRQDPEGATATVDLITRFNAMVHETPPLRAAFAEMLDGLAERAAHALGRATGTRGDSPENQVVGVAVVGLVRVQFDSMRRHAASSSDRDPALVRAAALDDVRLAADVVRRML